MPNLRRCLKVECGRFRLAMSFFVEPPHTNLRQKAAEAIHIFAHVLLTLTCARCAVALLMRLPPRRCRVAFVPRCLPLPRRPPLGWSKEQRFFDRRWMVLLMLQRFVPSAQLSFTTAVVVLALDGS